MKRMIKTMEMRNDKPIVISKCLLGEKVRYNGTDLQVEKCLLKTLAERYQIIPFCPEVAGGLPIPRDPAEIQNGEGYDVLCGNAKIVTTGGVDVTSYFVTGAQMLLKLCKENKAKIAILTELSPSCGSKIIYSGCFTGTKKAGSGVAAALLKANGIRVINQHEISEILEKNEC